MNCSTPLRWSGVMPAITTPLASSGEVDFDGAASHAQWMIDQGCDGVVVGGSLGEGQSLCTEEKCELWRRISSQLRDHAPVIAAIGSASTREGCSLATRAEESGCNALMILPPYVHSGDEREALHHVETIARATNLPAMIYNNPTAYRADFSAQSLAALASRLPNVRAVKDSTGDARRIAQLVELVQRGDAPSELVVFVGLDDIVPEGVAAGAQGWVAGLANALPVASVALWKLAKEQRRSSPSEPFAQPLHGKVSAEEVNSAFLQLLRMDTLPDFVQRIKFVQSRFGHGSEQVRPPRLPLGSGERDECVLETRTAIRALERLGIPTTAMVSNDLGVSSQ